MSLIKKLLTRLLNGKNGHGPYGRSRPYHPHASSDHPSGRPWGHGTQHHNQFGQSYYKKRKNSSFYSS